MSYSHKNDQNTVEGLFNNIQETLNEMQVAFLDRGDLEIAIKNHQNAEPLKIEILRSSVESLWQYAQELKGKAEKAKQGRNTTTAELCRQLYSYKTTVKFLNSEIQVLREKLVRLQLEKLLRHTLQ